MSCQESTAGKRAEQDTVIIVGYQTTPGLAVRADRCGKRSYDKGQAERLC